MSKKSTNSAGVVSTTPPFKGYTIEEIRYQRALVGLRKEFCKAKLMESLAAITPGKKNGEGRMSGLLSGPKSKRGAAAWKIAQSVASKIFSNLNTIDYVVMGLSMFGTIKKVFGLFKKKKKN